MNQPVLVRHPDGKLTLHHPPAWLIETLARLPYWLDPDADLDPAVRDRWFPRPVEDESDPANEDWERLVVPELYALLASARDIVTRDLDAWSESQRKRESEGYLTIPVQHRSAWISALNSARLHLGTKHQVGPVDLEAPFAIDATEPREQALAQIHVLGWFQGLLIEEELPSTLDQDPDEGDDPSDPESDEPES